MPSLSSRAFLTGVFAMTAFSQPGQAAVVPGAHPRCGAGSSVRILAAARGADAMQAGIPTPSYADPQTASTGTAATYSRTEAILARWPTAYCGRAPPQRWTWV